MAHWPRSSQRAYFEWEFGRPDPGTFEMNLHRTDDPLAEYTDKLDQRFSGAQE